MTEASVGLGLDQTGGRRLDGGLGARRRAKLDLGIINVKIDRPLHQAELLRDCSRCLAARHPGQSFDLMVVQLHELRLQLGGQSCPPWDMGTKMPD